MESLTGQPAIHPPADQRPTPRRTLLLLAALGDRWGLAAAGASRRSGFEVRRTAELEDLLERIERARVNPGADDDRNRLTAAVLVSAATLGEPPATAWRELVRRTAAAELPLIVLTDPAHGRRPPGDATDGEPHHVFRLDTEPSESALEVLLGAARLECARRLHTRELRAELRAAGEREQRLLARVGHELRNPLGAITSALCLMRDCGTPEGSLASYRHLIERQVEHLSRAVDELLTVSHPAAGEVSATSQSDGDGGGASEDADRPTASASPRPAGNGTPVLLVEDDPDGRHALSELLSMWDYAVQAAASGEDGVELARRHPPAVALVDIGLPGIDGYEVARRIRRHHPETPPLLVAMTGFGQPEDRDRALAAGFDLHLVKPVRPSRLAELLAGRR